MISIPIAGYRQVYDNDAVAALHAAQDDSGTPYLKKTYQKMLQYGGVRYLIKPSRADALDELTSKCPNFETVVTDLKKYLRLAVDGDESMSFVPLLLAGDPGVGKTHFAKMLAKTLGLDYEFCSMGSLTAGFVLGGSAPTWQGARCGKVASKLIEGETANPVFVLDELDKAGGDSRYDPMNTLLQLLETETATHFKDEFLDVALDTSVILWVATANDLGRIPEPILSRMSVYEVPSPTAEQAALIAQMVYAGVLAEHKWKFDPELATTVVEALAAIAPRDMKKRLIDAMGSAAMRGARTLAVDDVAGPRRPKKNPIGFGC
jgi:ATP-dependent Lon protease